MRIIWSENAKTDLDSIYAFQSLTNERAAVKIYNNILEETEILLRFPTIAPVESLLPSKKYLFRSLVTKSGKHKIIYFINRDIIYISHIWDCRRNPKDLRYSGNT